MSDGIQGWCRLSRSVRERSGGALRQTPPQILIATAAEEKTEGRRFGAAAPDRILACPGQRPLFLQFYMEEKEKARRHVGIDLAKRTTEARVVGAARLGGT
ncbi:MAG: hypothetical protein LBG27_12695, partial [Spirochaetaceae bacterium]|nr:hypothetical protein [Spirochaetaceae bacterium]